MPKIIAIGASQGGVQVLQKIAAGLPADFPLPVLIVLHIGAEPSQMPSILTAAGPLPAVHAEHGKSIQPGRIYIAPPDRHLVVMDGHLQLSHGPRENYVRPAIDPLFRSVAEHYGDEAIGVVLTGRLNDGTSGLWRSSGAAASPSSRTLRAPRRRRCRKARLAMSRWISACPSMPSRRSSSALPGRRGSNPSPNITEQRP